LKDTPGCLGPPNNAGNRQALIDHVTSAVQIESWIDRVTRLPDYVVRDACQFVARADLNVPQVVADALEDWLCDRRTGIRALVENNRAEFTAVTSWTL
jgi:hypothetical protein